jgi:hypothetical protein
MMSRSFASNAYERLGQTFSEPGVLRGTYISEVAGITSSKANGKWYR